MPKFIRQSFAALLIAFWATTRAGAQTELATTIEKKLAPLPLEERVILSTSPRLSAWAERYELLFDTLPRPFSAPLAAKILQKYAAERIVLTSDYADSAELRKFADYQGIMLSEMIHLPAEADRLLCENAALSHALADFLRQTPAQQTRLYWYMLAGLVTGIIATVIYRETARRKKKQQT